MTFGPTGWRRDDQTIQPCGLQQARASIVATVLPHGFVQKRFVQYPNEELIMSSTTKSATTPVDADTNVASKMADQISTGIEEVTRSASRFGERLRENGSALNEELSAASERFGEGAKRFGTVASEQIRAHPLAAVGIAVAAGVVVSRLMRRR